MGEGGCERTEKVGESGQNNGLLVKPVHERNAPRQHNNKTKLNDFK